MSKMAAISARPSKEELEKLYWEERKTLIEIGEVYNLSDETVRYHMKRFGIERRKNNPMGYWKDWVNFEAEMRKAIEENGGKFPTNKKLIVMEKQSLRIAITKYYGGMDAVKKKMGYDFRRRSAWESYEAWRKEGIEKGYNKRSSMDIVNSKNPDEKYWYMAGSRKKWVTNFSFNRKQRPKNYWRGWNNFEAEMKRAIEKNNDGFPTQKQLQKMGRSYLINAIRRYHGGLSAVRERMGYDESGFPVDSGSGNPLERILTGYVERDVD